MVFFYVIDDNNDEVVKIYKSRQSANAWIKKHETDTEIRYYIQRVENK